MLAQAAQQKERIDLVWFTCSESRKVLSLAFDMAGDQNQ
jgi:carbonic anhydrase